jgi:hypothetical protein
MTNNGRGISFGRCLFLTGPRLRQAHLTSKWKLAILGRQNKRHWAFSPYSFGFETGKLCRLSSCHMVSNLVVAEV